MVLIYRIITVVLSLISIISILISDLSLPKNLIVLPTMFLFLFIVLPMFSKYIFKYIGITILNLSMLIRYVITPFLNSIYGIEMNIGVSTAIDSQFRAINLMVFEMVSVMVIWCLFYKKFYSDKANPVEIKSKPNLFGWLFMIFASIVLIINPEILGRYTFIWLASVLKSKTVVEGASINFLIIQLAQIVLTVSLLNLIYRFYRNDRKIWYLFLSIIIIVFSASFITGTSRFSVILPLTTGFFTLIILFKKYRKFLIGAASIIVLIVISLTTMLKRQTINSMNMSTKSSISGLEGMNTDLQLYFSGITNVAHAVETKITFVPFNFDAIFSDLLKNVPIINKVFESSSSALVNYNEMFYNRILISDQILPNIGQGFLYFGPLLAPIFSVISVIVVMILDKQILKSDSVFEVYIFTYLCLKFALFYMSNMTIQIAFFTNFFLLLLLINYMNKKFILKRS